jgi:hypothetical protein
MEAIPLPTKRVLLKLFAQEKQGFENYSHPKASSSQDLVMYDKARWALADAVDTLIDSSSKKAWIPSYMCNEAISPLRKKGIKIGFYPVDKYLRPVLTYIRIEDAQSEVFVFVHYFGFSPFLKEVVLFCKENKLKLIEDAAHCLGASSSVGVYGDAIVYSPRKILPICGGGILCLANTEAGQLKSLVAPVTYQHELIFLCGLWGRKLMNSMRLPYRQIKVRLKPDNVSKNNISAQVCEPRLGIGQISKRIIGAFNQKEHQNIKTIRRRNYLTLEQLLTPLKHVQLLFTELPDGACPYVLPVCIKHRDVVVKLFSQNGIPIQKWPQLPPEVAKNSAYRDAQCLAERVLLLPVHQDISIKDLKKMRDLFERFYRYRNLN